MFYSIDFGTCNSVVSFLNNNSEIDHVYDPVGGNILIPTTIYFIQDDINSTFEHRKNYFIGSEANENYNIYKNVNCYFYQFKRLLGITSKSNSFEFDFIKKLNIQYELDEDNVYIFIPANDDKKIKISIVELTSLYIKGLCDYINNKNINVYITAPAYFNDLQKTQLMNAYKLSNCKVLKYYNEPTAATIYYLNTFYKKEQGSKKIAIFDIGGGTTDITIVEYDFESKTCDIIDVSGNNSLGGVDIDMLLIDDIYKNYNIDKNNKKWKKKISDMAEYIKIQLSTQSNVKVILEEVPLLINNNIIIKELLEIQYTRTKFNSIINNIVIELTNLLMDMQKTHDIFDIIPIGGTTQIPIIHEKININKNNEIQQSTFLYKSIVSDGACMMSKLIQNNDDFIIMDIVSMNLYIKTNDYLCVIPKNTKIPTLKEYILTTSRDAQRSIEIEIFEGDNKYHVGSYTILNIPPYKKGSILITLLFKINVSGLMNITVQGCMNKANEKGTFELNKDIKIISNTCIKNLLKSCLKK